MNQIVNVNLSWGIGKDGDLLCHIPEDMRFFKETTMGKTVIMGRKNLESFPGGNPLKGRKNIVLTRSLDNALEQTFVSPDTELIFVDSIDKLFELLPKDTSEVFVIGGESIYRLLLPYCDTFYVTKNTCTAEADTFYPDLDNEPGLSLIYESGEKEHNGVSYRFCTYKRMQVQS